MSVWAPYWILAEERLRKSKQKNEKKGEGRAGDFAPVLPKVNTTSYGLKSWRYSAAILWNSMPDPIRSLDNYKSFKKQLRKLNLIGIN